MPAVATEINASVNEPGGGGPSTPLGPFTSTVTFGGYRLCWRGVTQYNPHPHNPSHSGKRLIIDPGQNTLFFENHPIAYVGDALQDGDTISPNDINGNPVAVDTTTFG